MIWLQQHLDALRYALSRLRLAPVNTGLSVLAIGIALALPAGGQLLIDNASRFARQATPTPQISLYLRMDADEATVKAVTNTLALHPGVARSEFLARETTLERYRRSEGLRDVIDVLPRNPFPHAFVVTPRDAAPEAMDALAVELRSVPKVEHVQLDSDWARRLDALLRLGRTVVSLLSLMLGVGIVAITFTITRLQVLTQRDEIEVSELLGATASFIRRPFLYFGTALGLCGGLLAWLIVLGGGAGLGQPLGELAQLYGVSAQLTGLSATESVGLLTLAALLGWLGTALSLRQHLSRG